MCGKRMYYVLSNFSIDSHELVHRRLFWCFHVESSPTSMCLFVRSRRGSVCLFVRSRLHSSHVWFIPWRCCGKFLGICHPLAWWLWWCRCRRVVPWLSVCAPVFCHTHFLPRKCISTIPVYQLSAKPSKHKAFRKVLHQCTSMNLGLFSPFV